MEFYDEVTMEIYDYSKKKKTNKLMGLTISGNQSVSSPNMEIGILLENVHKRFKGRVILTTSKMLIDIINDGLMTDRDELKALWICTLRKIQSFPDKEIEAKFGTDKFNEFSLPIMMWCAYNYILMKKPIHVVRF